MATKIDTIPLPECNTALDTQLRATPMEAMASAMCAAAAVDCGIDPYSTNRVDHTVIAETLATLPLAPSTGISIDKVGEALARLRPVARNGKPSDRAFLAALFSDSFRQGPWHR